jgi:hypothetical protein
VFERTWLSEMMKGFVQILESIEQDEEGEYNCWTNGYTVDIIIVLTCLYHTIFDRKNCVLRTVHGVFDRS